jgi:translation initiation factor IF-3
MARKKQVIMKVKEVQFRPGTDQHDIDYKVRNIVTFLEEGDKAKITIMFRGREITHQENGRKIMDMIIEKTKEIAVIEQFPMMEGRKMIMVLAPGKKKPGGAPQSPASKPDGKPESKP